MENENNEEALAPKDSAVTILAEVAAAISDSTKEVRNRLVASLVSKEIQSRAELLGKALEERMQMGSELQKIKPDVLAYDENGKETSSSWSKEQAKRLKETKEKLAKIDKKIELALSGDWSKIKGG